jgi:hypothetical protein
MIHFIISVLTDAPSLKFERWQMPAFKRDNRPSHLIGRLVSDNRTRSVIETSNQMTKITINPAPPIWFTKKINRWWNYNTSKNRSRKCRSSILCNFDCFSKKLIWVICTQRNLFKRFTKRLNWWWNRHRFQNGSRKRWSLDLNWLRTRFEYNWVKRSTWIKTRLGKNFNGWKFHNCFQSRSWKCRFFDLNQFRIKLEYNRLKWSTQIETCFWENLNWWWNDKGFQSWS